MACIRRLRAGRFETIVVQFGTAAVLMVGFLGCTSLRRPADQFPTPLSGTSASVVGEAGQSSQGNQPPQGDLSGHSESSGLDGSTIAEVVPASHQNRMHPHSGFPKTGRPNMAYEAASQPSATYRGSNHPTNSCQDANCLQAGCLDASCGACAGCCSDGMPSPAQRLKDPQEYIFDGGDMDPSVNVRKDWSAAGVNSTDTVVYYETLGGKICVQPTNRVAVYAPRFGAVRQVTGAVFAESALAPARVLAPLAVDNVEDQNRATGVTLSTGPIAQKQIQQLDRFREDKRMISSTSVVPPVPVSDAVAALINVDVSAVDLAAIREMTVERAGADIVETTFLPESLSVIVDGQFATLAVGVQRVADVHVYELPDRCSIRITKSVSHTLAGPGDIIRFTLRFENIGPNKVGNVVILDSLSSRLEYIGASQQSSIATRFSAQANEVGSMELRWELESPLEPNEGGVISFDCRVR